MYVWYSYYMQYMYTLCTFLSWATGPDWLDMGKKAEENPEKEPPLWRRWRRRRRRSRRRTIESIGEIDNRRSPRANDGHIRVSMVGHLLMHVKDRRPTNIYSWHGHGRTVNWRALHRIRSKKEDPLMNRICPRLRHSKFQSGMDLRSQTGCMLSQSS